MAKEHFICRKEIQVQRDYRLSSLAQSKHLCYQGSGTVACMAFQPLVELLWCCNIY